MRAVDELIELVAIEADPGEGVICTHSVEKTALPNYLRHHSQLSYFFILKESSSNWRLFKDNRRTDWTAMSVDFTYHHHVHYNQKVINTT